MAVLLLAALGVVVRLHGVSAPPFDFHPTRQYYALLFAQDYRHTLCGDARSPEALAARASREGEALLEPPLIPAVTAVGWCALGVESTALPRVLQSVVWSLGALALAGLAQALGGGPLAALTAAGWMLFHPYAIAAGRSVQPDGPMVTLLLVGAWQLARHRDDGDHRAWRRGICALSAAALVKLVAVFFAAPLVLWSMRTRPKSLGDKALAAGSLIPAGLWYAWGWFVEGSLRHQGGGRFRPWLLLTGEFWNELGARVERVTGLWPVALSLSLTLLALRGRARSLSLAWFAGQVCLGVAFTQHIYTHDYYSLPLLPWVGLALGLSVDRAVRGLSRGQGAVAAGVTLCGALLALRGVRGAWRDAGLALRDAGGEVREAERIGQAVGHGADVLMQARWYGLPMKFHGRFAAEHWPDHVELAEDARAWSVEERVRRGYRGRRFNWFVVADLPELSRQPALAQALRRRCVPTLRTEGAAVFACSPGVWDQMDRVNTTR